MSRSGSRVQPQSHKHKHTGCYLVQQISSTVRVSCGAFTPQGVTTALTQHSYIHSSLYSLPFLPLLVCPQLSILCLLPHDWQVAITVRSLAGGTWLIGIREKFLH